MGQPIQTEYYTLTWLWYVLDAYFQLFTYKNMLSANFFFYTCSVRHLVSPCRAHHCFSWTTGTSEEILEIRRQIKSKFKLNEFLDGTRKRMLLNALIFSPSFPNVEYSPLISSVWRNIKYAVVRVDGIGTF